MLPGLGRLVVAIAILFIAAILAAGFGARLAPTAYASSGVHLSLAHEAAKRPSRACGRTTSRRKHRASVNRCPRSARKAKAKKKRRVTKPHVAPRSSAPRSTSSAGDAATPAQGVELQAPVELPTSIEPVMPTEGPKIKAPPVTVETSPTESPPVESGLPFRFFAPTSVWNEPLAADAPLDPNSAALVGAFDEEVAHEEQFDQAPYINSTAYSVPIYTVPVDQPTVRVTLEHIKPPPALQSAWDAVPLPSNAQPAVGPDGHLVVWQPSTNRLWEFWRLVHGSGGWSATWGGAMQDVSSDSGVYSAEAWPGAKSDWGASASSLSIAGGLITLEDLKMGQINHALAIAIPEVAGGVYASPAQRTDGTSTAPLSLPEGARLRLDPSLNLASLHLPRLTLMLAEAAQRYGIIVRDDAPSTISFFAQDPIPTGNDPYSGTSGYFEGKPPNQILAAFPWNHLQLLKMELHSAS